MEIDLTIEQEAQLSQIAALEGKDADQVAREVFLRGLQIEVALMVSRPDRNDGQQTVARLLESRYSNMLPEGVTIEHLISEGRA